MLISLIEDRDPGRCTFGSVPDDATASFDEQRIPPELCGVKFRRGKPFGAEQELLAGEPAGRTSTITTPPEVLVSRAGA